MHRTKSPNHCVCQGLECEYLNSGYEKINSAMQDLEPEPEAIAGLPDADTLTPSDRYQELFADVQEQRIFADSKTFADCAPIGEPLDILIRYRKLKQIEADFDLRQFVENNFEFPNNSADFSHNLHKKPICQHIDELWDLMIRSPKKHRSNCSLLPLPENYVVPGGRFDETYYWDSYFSMLGLAESGRSDLLVSMANNFAWLIEKYGHIPNGNRTYYLSRSQPPVFALMVELFEKVGLPHRESYLPFLVSEHHYWMDGCHLLEPKQAYRHLVCMPDGALLNRYWDDRDTPRDESWREDIETAQGSGRPAQEVYRDLRAGAASGWDYSSRWLRDANRLASIRTTQIIPIDLNAFLYKLETTIVRLSKAMGETYSAAAWQQKADARQAAINTYLWDDELGAYRDYDWRREHPAQFSAAAVVALYTGVANPEQAKRLATSVRKTLLISGGLLTSTVASGEQWDKPNAWAPLQWMAVQGFNAYGETQLARDIALRWLIMVNERYLKDRKLVEKYDICDLNGAAAGGGEYPLQDGFGWTNGVTRCLMSQYGHLLPTYLTE